MVAPRAVSALVALVLAALLLALAACGGDAETESPANSPSPQSQSPESPTSSTAEPSAPPSDNDQSGPPKVTATVATGLEVPWGIDFLPDGTAVVTERDSARVLAVSPKGDGWEVSQIGVVEAAAPEVEGGLLGVAVSPDWSADPSVYLYVTTAEDNRVMRTRFGGGGLAPAEPILTGIPRGFIHDGGRLAFGPDGYLYVSTGETGVPELAQDPDSLAGKILRITTAGRPAPGNPDPDSPVWSLGHRNVQGLAWDDQDRLWASEFGQDTYDELNLIEPGGNYGWPRVEGKAADNPGVSAEGFIDPVLTWRTQDASPSGLAYVDGSLWMGALRGARLWQIRLPANGEARAHAHFVGEYGRLRSVAVAPAAEGEEATLWVTTSNRDGRGSPVAEDDRILQVTP